MSRCCIRGRLRKLMISCYCYCFCHCFIYIYMCSLYTYIYICRRTSIYTIYIYIYIYVCIRYACTPLPEPWFTIITHGKVHNNKHFPSSPERLKKKSLMISFWAVAIPYVLFLRALWNYMNRYYICSPPPVPILRNCVRPRLNRFINIFFKERAENHSLQGYPFTGALVHNNNPCPRFTIIATFRAPPSA